MLTGAPVWLSGLKPLPSAQVMIPDPGIEPHIWLSAQWGALLPPLSLSAALPTCNLCLSNK